MVRSVKSVTKWSFSVPTSRTVLLVPPGSCWSYHQPIDESRARGVEVEAAAFQAPMCRCTTEAVEG